MKTIPLIVLMMVSVSGFIGCDSSFESNSQINTPNESSVATKPQAGKFKPTHLDGVFVATRRDVEDYVEALTGKPAIVLEILSDRDFWLTYNDLEEDSQREICSFRKGSHCLFYSTFEVPAVKQVKVGEIHEFPFWTSGHWNSENRKDEMTFEEALSMTGMQLLQGDRGVSLGGTLKFKIPTIDEELQELLGSDAFTHTQLVEMRLFGHSGGSPEIIDDSQSLTLIDVGRTHTAAKNRKRVFQTFVAFRLQLEPPQASEVIQPQDQDASEPDSDAGTTIIGGISEVDGN